MKVEMGMTMRYAHSLFTVGLGHSETFGMFSLRSDKLQPRTNPVDTLQKLPFCIHPDKQAYHRKLKDLFPLPYCNVVCSNTRKCTHGLLCQNNIAAGRGRGVVVCIIYEAVLQHPANSVCDDLKFI